MQNHLCLATPCGNGHGCGFLICHRVSRLHDFLRLQAVLIGHCHPQAQVVAFITAMISEEFSGYLAVQRLPGLDYIDNLFFTINFFGGLFGHLYPLIIPIPWMFIFPDIRRACVVLGVVIGVVVGIVCRHCEVFLESGVVPDRAFLGETQVGDVRCVIGHLDRQRDGGTGFYHRTISQFTARYQGNTECAELVTHGGLRVIAGVNSDIGAPVDRRGILLEWIRVRVGPAGTQHGARTDQALVNVINDPGMINHRDPGQWCCIVMGGLDLRLDFVGAQGRGRRGDALAAVNKDVARRLLVECLVIAQHTGADQGLAEFTAGAQGQGGCANPVTIGIGHGSACRTDDIGGRQSIKCQGFAVQRGTISTIDIGQVNGHGGRRWVHLQPICR